MNEELILEFIKSYMAGKPTAKYENEFKTAGQSQDEMNAAVTAYMKTPEGRQAAKDITQSKSSDRFVKRNLPLFNALVQGADIATSISQIRQSNTALKNLRQPAMPQSPGVDPALNNEIYKAQVGSFDASRAVAPIEQAARDQYQRDLGVASQVSGGNSSSYAAQANAAGLRRVRNMAGAPAVADQIRREQQSRLDGLIGQRAQTNQNTFQNNYNLGQTALNQYNQNMASAGALGQTGRTNLRNVFQTLPQNALGIVGQHLGANDPYSQYEAQVEANLAGLKTPMQNLRNRYNVTPQLSQQGPSYRGY